jgi:hypothetical protein
MISTPWPYGAPLTWAKKNKWQFLVHTGVVGVRAFHYLVDTEQTEPHGSEIPGLLVRARGKHPQPLDGMQRSQRGQDTARWHASSGIYGFLALEAGEVIIEVVDPKGRYLPEVISVVAPNRKTIKEALQQGELPPSDDPTPACVDILLRPSALMAAHPGTTRLWGVVSKEGREVPAAVVQIETVYKGKPATVTTMSLADGSYMLELPGELAEQRTDPTELEIRRRLHVFVPELEVLQQLRNNFIAALPVDLFRAKKYNEMQEVSYMVVQQLDHSARGPRSPTNHHRTDRTDRPREGENQAAVVLPGRLQRCDIQLTN